MEALSYVHLLPGQPLPAMPVGPLRAVVVAEASADAEWLSLTADWLVASGCLYALAWGRACEAWHDEIDRASMAAFGGGELPDDRFVMTTWHENEPLSEAFWFAAHCASHPDVDLPRTLIVHIATEDREAHLRAAYRSAAETAV